LLLSSHFCIVIIVLTNVIFLDSVIIVLTACVIFLPT